MKRLTILFLATAAILPIGVSEAATNAHTAGSAKLQLRHTALGSILVNRGGNTVFAFTHDSRNHDRCAATPGCSGVWPMITTTGTPALGPGVKRSLVGTIKVGGARQVTYAGHPLYTYIGDAGPGDTSYVGQSQFGGKWFALNAAGQFVK
jgi:predicted lipoprotein with Yx(FWY)xxD motif